MTDEQIIHRTYEPFKFLGRLFWVPLTVEPHTSAVSYNPTWEASGEHWGPTVVVRIPLTRKALGLGVWLDVNYIPVAVQSEDAEFDTYVAVNGEVNRDDWDAARAYIASQGLDPSEEMEAMQSMGLFG